MSYCMYVYWFIHAFCVLFNDVAWGDKLWLIFPLYPWRDKLWLLLPTWLYCESIGGGIYCVILHGTGIGKYCCRNINWIIKKWYCMLSYCHFLESDQWAYLRQLYCDCLATFGSTVVQHGWLSGRSHYVAKTHPAMYITWPTSNYVVISIGQFVTWKHYSAWQLPMVVWSQVNRVEATMLKNSSFMLC